MTSWSRRDVLRALGVSSAVPALATIGAACGGVGSVTRARSDRDAGNIDRVRRYLREVVSALDDRFEYATGLATLRTISSAAADNVESGLTSQRRAEAVLVASDGVIVNQYATTDLSRDGLVRAAEELGASFDRAGKKPPTNRALSPLPPPTAEYQPQLVHDPAEIPYRDWLGRVAVLLKRSQRFGGSPVVYRGAYVHVDDATTVFVGDGRDLIQRLVRTRGGVTMVAWTGGQASAEVLSHGGTIGLEALVFTDDQLERLAVGALAHLTAQSAPRGEFDVILDPTVVSALIHHCVGRLFEADRWSTNESIASDQTGERIGSELVTVFDDPNLAGGYGSYRFDDEGTPPRRTELITNGIVGAPITDRATAAALSLPQTGHGRRSSPLSPVLPRLSNLVVVPGHKPLEQMIREVDHGYLIEGAIAANTDHRTWRTTLTASRAREIAGGRMTGRLHRTLDLLGDLPSLLGQVRDVSSTWQVIALDDAAAGREPIPISVSSPFLRTRAVLAGRG